MGPEWRLSIQRSRVQVPSSPPFNKLETRQKQKGPDASLAPLSFERVRERQIPAEDLYKLKLWRESQPDAPDGLWYKDFGSLKIVGEGEFPKTFLPKTFLLKGQTAKGKSL